MRLVGAPFLLDAVSPHERETPLPVHVSPTTSYFAYEP
jgi:hypothetical protein